MPAFDYEQDLRTRLPTNVRSVHLASWRPHSSRVSSRRIGGRAILCQRRGARVVVNSVTIPAEIAEGDPALGPAESERSLKVSIVEGSFEKGVPEEDDAVAAFQLKGLCRGRSATVQERLPARSPTAAQRAFRVIRMTES